MLSFFRCGLSMSRHYYAEGEQSSIVGTFVAIAGLPWALQFVWGPLIDRFQVSKMGRRRPWVIVSQIFAFIASLGLLLVKNPPTQSIKTLMTAFFVHSIFASVQDASVDAQAISTIPQRERGRINGVMRGGFLLGSALGAAGLSFILRKQGFFFAAVINSLFLFVFTVITFFIKEKSDDSLFPWTHNRQKNRRQHILDHSILWLFKELFSGLLSIESLRLFIPIVICYSSQSAFIRAYNIHLIKELKWTDTDVSVMSGAWGTLSVVFIVLIGGWLADRTGARRLLIIVMSIHSLYMWIINLVSSYWIRRSAATAGLILWSLMDPILSTAAMPILMSLCRSHVEGGQFTTYMSLINLCDLLGAFISGHIQRHFKAPVIGLGCAVLITIALITVIIGIWKDKKNKSRQVPMTSAFTCSGTSTGQQIKIT
ncbi:unnamed protein product [Didymodactylos carnosus]|uniref:Major facilitator superfamily (MFS) profile domain-containing protein n=1 Tax=Didymodactylos carnosus TaxID=1234261 RepID=A0A815TAG7_9BILA|nr:unnamed protein product [Didymodactylos carnosus]CAF4364605.1 unnamed protein product [Didymodactylos carnosus]